MVTIRVSWRLLRRGAGLRLSRRVVLVPLEGLVAGLARDLCLPLLRLVASLAGPVACLHRRIAAHLRMSAARLRAGDTSRTGWVGGQCSAPWC